MTPCRWTIHLPGPAPLESKDGVIVTDLNDIYNLYERDHIAESRKDAVRIAINAGIDMAMVPLDRDFCVYLRELVEEGLVSERRIDDAVRRILRLKMRIGLFEEPFPDTSKFDRFASDEFAAVALQDAVVCTSSMSMPPTMRLISFARKSACEKSSSAAMSRTHSPCGRMAVSRRSGPSLWEIRERAQPNTSGVDR